MSNKLNSIEDFVYLYEPEIPKIPKKEREAIYKIFNSIGKNPKDFYTSGNIGKIRIEENQVVYLNFHGLGLKELPKEIKDLKNLEVLYAPYNQLIILPEEIESLKELKKFYASHNPLNDESKLLLKRLKAKGVDIGADILYNFIEKNDKPKK